jgi:hypothetical protein
MSQLFKGQQTCAPKNKQDTEMTTNEEGKKDTEMGEKMTLEQIHKQLKIARENIETFNQKVHYLMKSGPSERKTNMLEREMGTKKEQPFEQQQANYAKEIHNLRGELTTFGTKKKVEKKKLVK